MFFRRRKQEPEEPQPTRIDWGIERHREAMLQSRLFDIAAQLTRIRFPKGAEDEETIVASFTKTHNLLQDWFQGAPLKDQIQEMLDKLYPDPPGYEPGEIPSFPPRKWNRLGLNQRPADFQSATLPLSYRSY